MTAPLHSPAVSPAWVRPPGRELLPLVERPGLRSWDAAQALLVDATRGAAKAAELEPSAAPARAAAARARHLARRAWAVRPTPERVRVARDLLRAGGLAAVTSRARAKLHAPLPSTSRAPDPVFTRTARVPAEPWPGDLPLVTVVVPNYNSGTYLARCVASLAGQTASRVEVLVVDSASTDPASVEALERLEAAPPLPMRVIRRPDRHLLGCNRNVGWREARGRYVCFLDPDDALAPTYLDACLFHLELHGYDAVGAGVRYFEGASGSWDDMQATSTLEQALLRCPTSAPAVVRRDLLAAADGFHDTGLGAHLIYEDWKFWVRALALGARIRNIPAQLLEVRVHAGGQSRHAAIPDMDAQRAAIVAYNADVLTPSALTCSADLASTRVEVVGAVAALASVAGAPSVLVVVDELEGCAKDRTLAAAVRDWQAAGTRVVIVAESARSRRGSDWAAAAGLSTDDVHVLGELVPVGDWLDYCHYLIAAKTVGQAWRWVRGEPGVLAGRLPVELTELIVVDLLADDFVPRIVV